METPAIDNIIDQASTSDAVEAQRELTDLKKELKETKEDLAFYQQAYYRLLHD